MFISGRYISGGRWDIAGFLRRLIRAVREEQPEIVNSYLTNLVTTVLRPFAPDIKLYGALDALSWILIVMIGSIA